MALYKVTRLLLSERSVVIFLLKGAVSDRSYLCICWRVTKGLLPENPELEMLLNGRKSLFTVVSMPVILSTIKAAT